MSSSIKAVVFDIGNVLIKIHQEKIFERLLQDISPERLQQFLNHQTLFEQFEEGKLSEEHFRLQVQNALQTQYSDQEFDEIWSANLGDDVEGIEELLAELAPKIPLYTLSNTNSIHYRCFQSRSYFRHFRKLYMSQEMFLRKPNPLIYYKLQQHIQLPFEQILFFDDLPENIKAAQQLGIEAKQCFQSSHDLRTMLRSYSLLN